MNKTPMPVQYNDVLITGQGVTAEEVRAKFGVTAGNLVIVAFAVSLDGVTLKPPDGGWVHSPFSAPVKEKSDLWYMIVDATQAGRASWVWTLNPSSLDPFSGVAHIEEWAGEFEPGVYEYPKEHPICQLQDWGCWTYS